MTGQPLGFPKDDDEVAVEAFCQAAIDVMFRMPWPRSEDRWHESQSLVDVAVVSLPSTIVADRPTADAFVYAAGQLLGAAASALMPLAIRGVLTLSPDEWGYELIEEVLPDEYWWCAERTGHDALAELRAGLGDVYQAARRLASSRIETCSPQRMWDVADPAVRWSMRAVILAIGCDAALPDRVRRG